MTNSAKWARLLNNIDWFWHICPKDNYNFMKYIRIIFDFISNIVLIIATVLLIIIVCGLYNGTDSLLKFISALFPWILIYLTLFFSIWKRSKIFGFVENCMREIFNLYK